MNERRRSLVEGLGVTPNEADRLVERAVRGERIPVSRRRLAVGAAVVCAAAILLAWGVAWLAGSRVPWIPVPVSLSTVSVPRVGTETVGEWRVGSMSELLLSSDAPKFGANPFLAATQRAEIRAALVRIADRARRHPGPPMASLDDSRIPRTRRTGLVSLGAVGTVVGSMVTANLAVPSPGPDADALWRRERDDRIDDLLDRLERP